MVVKEDFVKNLYAIPSGERKVPTVFDEFRHAVQHSQKPLEQVIQLISEMHGVWVGTNSVVANLLLSLLSLYSDKQNKGISNQVKTALNVLKSISNNSTIGRQNTMVANDMDIPTYREFISKAQAIHPSVNAYIQNNIGKYPHFQQISEQVGSLGQIVLTSKDIHPLKRIEIDGKNTMTTDYPLRRNVDTKMFKNVGHQIDISTSLVNCLFLRALRPNNCGPILDNGSITTKSHGYDYVMDTENADRNKKVVPECLAKAVNRFGPTTQLLNSYFPISYEVQNRSEFYEITTETGSCYVDRLNRPIAREIPIPVAKDEDVVQIA